MGKGKGAHHVWISLIKKGQVLCEIFNSSIEKFNLSFKALHSASSKLPLKTKIIYNYY
jgi:ribosomal protein L16/L10AE